MKLAVKIEPGGKVKLDEYDPDHSAGLTKEMGIEKLEALDNELGELQELLYAARQHAVLVVLQGMDTSGKDGTIRQVMSEVNPQGCRVESFKVPTEEELSHDF